jgi:NADH-quinone oxidoreductase subunit C
MKTAAPAPVQVPLDNELSRRYRQRFGDAILDALEDRKQSILIVDAAQLLEIARYSRDEEKFDLLEDYTAVDWPRREKRFDLVAQLYSFTHNTRLRLKIPLHSDEQPATLVPIWPAANWLEREIFDLFGIVFLGHPNLKRILLPDEWQGHPLRKDYDILQQDTAWVRENLGIESGQ